MRQGEPPIGFLQTRNHNHDHDNNDNSNDDNDDDDDDDDNRSQATCKTCRHVFPLTTCSERNSPGINPGAFTVQRIYKRSSTRH